jgi:hypothetical protein
MLAQKRCPHWDLILRTRSILPYIEFVRLENESSAENRRDENNGAADERSNAKVGAQRRSSALAGRWCRASRSDSTVSLTSKAGSGRTGVLATSALEARTGSATVLEVGLGIPGECGKLVSTDGDVPRARLGRTLGSGAACLVTTVTAGGRGLCVGTLEGFEIIHLGDGTAAEGNESVLGFFLGVFVDETTRVDRSHVAAVERRDLVELTGVLVATELRQAVYH